MTDLKQRAIVEAVVVFFLLGMVLPELVSAKSTVLTLLGLASLGVLAAYAFGLFPIKSAIVELIKKVPKE